MDWSKPISSLKHHGWTTRGEDGDASETRLCFNAVRLAEGAAEIGKGALKEKVEEDGTGLGCG